MKLWKAIGSRFIGGYFLWGKGFFAARSGNVTDEIIQGYIRNQDLEEQKKSDNIEVTLGCFQRPTPPHRFLPMGGELIEAQSCRNLVKIEINLIKSDLL